MPGPLSPDSPPLRSRSHLEGLSLLVSCPSSAIPPFWLRLSASLISFLHIVGSRICRFVGICPWHTHVAELFAVRICVIEERPSQLFPQRFYCPIFLMYFVLRAPPVLAGMLYNSERPTQLCGFADTELHDSSCRNHKRRIVHERSTDGPLLSNHFQCSRSPAILSCVEMLQRACLLDA